MSLVELKTKLCTEYLALSNQMTVTANAMQAYVRGLAATPTHEKTVQGMTPVPFLPCIDPKGGSALADAFVNLEASTNGKESKKRSRKSEGKKEKDPNAPKRPASGYIMYQNDVRARLKEQFPESDYKDIMTKISEGWKGMSKEEQQTWNDKSKSKMETWKLENAAYEASKTQNGGVSPAHHEASEEEEEESEPDTKSKAKAAAKPKASTSKKPVPAPVQSESEEGSDSESEDSPAPAPPVKKAKQSTPPASKSKKQGSPKKR